mmetsp:Transcript_49851/g.139522  ORF Transcript_49851/g.139522 Transcript_49851/m.139522 type:complete len:278 (-) Transcript_49851:409-1242(-)
MGSGTPLAGASGACWGEIVPGRAFNSRGASLAGARLRCARRCKKRPTPRNRVSSCARVPTRCFSADSSRNFVDSSDTRVALSERWRANNAAWRLIPALSSVTNKDFNWASPIFSCSARLATPEESTPRNCFESALVATGALPPSASTESASAGWPSWKSMAFLAPVRRTLEAIASSEAPWSCESSSSASSAPSSSPSSSSSSSLLDPSPLSSACLSSRWRTWACSCVAVMGCGCWSTANSLAPWSFVAFKDADRKSLTMRNFSFNVFNSVRLKRLAS